MKNQEIPPSISNQDWESGPLRSVTAAGAPGSPVTDLVKSELPLPLQSTLNRKSVSLWREPIEINHSMDVVGLEWLHSPDGLPDLLLIHIEDSTHYHASTTDDFRRREIEWITRTGTSKSATFIQKIFQGDVEMHSIATRGIAVMHENMHDPEVLSAGDHVLEFLTDKSQSRFLHSRCSHVLAVVALQSFAIEILNNSWPSSTGNKSEIKKFSEKFISYRHNLEWSDAFIDLESRRIYRELRALLSIEQKFDAFGKELQDLHRALEVNNSSALNRTGLIIAIAALVPVWLTAELEKLNNQRGIVGLSIALTSTAIAIWIGRRK